VNPKDNMADNIDTIVPSGGTDEEGTQKPAPSSEDWKQLVGGKFTTEAELAKAYKEIERKFGEQSDEVRKTREFAEVINPLLEEIRADPEIFNKLDERLRKKGQPDTSQPTSADNKGKAADDVRSVASDLVLARFEEKHGIDKLTPDEQKSMRQKIGDVILELTGNTLSNVDLRRLGPVLDNAYVLANKDKIIEKSKLEALASAQGVEEASISSIQSSSEKGEATLTPEEARTADRLGLSRQQYLEGKKRPAK
jgi:hypothetical protein